MRPYCGMGLVNGVCSVLFSHYVIYLCIDTNIVNDVGGGGGQRGVRLPEH